MRDDESPAERDARTGQAPGQVSGQATGQAPNANLFARLAEGFPADRGAVFLETEDGAEWSFARLLDLAGRMATVLRAAGATAGERVAAQVAASPESVCLYLACLQSGAVHAPLAAGCGAEVRAALLADLRPRVLVCDPEAEAAAAPAARAAGAALYTLAADGSGRLAEEARALPSDRAVARRRGADVAAILREGPAGRPSALTHDALWSAAARLHWRWGFRPGDRLIHALPPEAAEGLSAALNLMLMNGGRTLLLRDFDAERIIALLPRASVLLGAPEIYAALLASPRLTREACAGMRLFLCAGEAPPAATREAFAARTGRRIRMEEDETGVGEPPRAAC